MDDELRKKLDLLNKHMSQKPMSNDKQILTLNTTVAKEKMRKAKLGTKHKKSTKRKMSAIKKGKLPNNFGKKVKSKRVIPQDVRDKISKTLTGVVHSELSNIKRSATMSGKPKPKVTCPHCGVSGGKPVMTKHHFENCKQKA